MRTGFQHDALTRRSLIQRALLILGSVPMGLVGCVSHRGAAEATRWGTAALGHVPLSGAEIEALVAFGEVLVEGRTLATAERRYLIEHIEERTTRSPDDLSLYRATVKTIDRLAGRPFVGLDVSERIDLIARHRLAAGPTSGEALTDELRSVRARTVPDLVRGYYGSPAGWAAVGYDSFPGRCGDLARYTGPE